MEKSRKIDGIESKNIHKYMENIRKGNTREQKRDRNGDSGFDKAVMEKQEEERKKEEAKRKPVVSQIIVNSKEKVDRKIGLDIQKVDLKDISKSTRNRDYNIGKTKQSNGPKFDQSR